MDTNWRSSLARFRWNAVRWNLVERLEIEALDDRWSTSFPGIFILSDRLVAEGGGNGLEFSGCDLLDVECENGLRISW